MDSTKIIWNKYDIIDSTQIQAHKIISNIVYEKPIVIIADMQTNGFGRQGTSWKSPIGNLSATVCFMPKKEQQFVVIAAEIMQRTLKKLTNKTVVIIDNDIMYNNKKCGGIIATWQEDLKKQNILCVGIGFNCAVDVTVNKPTAFIQCDRNKLIETWLKEAENILF